MKLADKPIYPVKVQRTLDDGMFGEQIEVIEGGLTFRERLIEKAMVAILSNESLVSGIHNTDTQKWVAEHSISQADAIIKQLEEEKK